jgi:hypothetical protein
MTADAEIAPRLRLDEGLSLERDRF